MIPSMNPQVQMVVGIVLMIMGVLYFYKAILATVRGQLVYWDGWGILTLVSPWIVPGILPENKEKQKPKLKQGQIEDPRYGPRTLTKRTEGLWVHMVMAPLFFLSSFVALVAGAEYAGWPGASWANFAFNGLKVGRPDVIGFDKKFGFRFPVIARNKEQLVKLFGGKMGTKEQQEGGLGDNNESLDQACH